MELSSDITDFQHVYEEYNPNYNVITLHSS
jgi:hypothetical protein